MENLKVEFAKHGPKHDYRGAHVVWTVGDRRYLGEVVKTYRREFPSAIMFRVRHFNGSEAPNVAASAVEVLPRW